MAFLDLIEVRVVDAFLKEGVKWRVLGSIHEKARKLVGHAHPFATGRFRTDGRKVFESPVTGGGRSVGVTLDVLSDQFNFARVVEPYFKNLDFATDKIGGAIRWWPLGPDRNVVIDPQRSFGQAVVAEEGVPTLVLARAVATEHSVERVARWFVVRSEAVADAIEWESRLAHAA